MWFVRIYLNSKEDLRWKQLYVTRSLWHLETLKNTLNIHLDISSKLVFFKEGKLKFCIAFNRLREAGPSYEIELHLIFSIFFALFLFSQTGMHM